MPRDPAILGQRIRGSRPLDLPAEVQARVASYLTAGGVPTTPGNPAVTVTATTITRGTRTWAATTVSSNYTHSYLFLNGIVGWFGGSLTPTNLRANSTMRDELGSYPSVDPCGRSPRGPHV